VTTAAENLQGYLRASWGAWGSLMGAWTQAVTEVYRVVAEWAVEENEYLGFGESEVFVNVAADTVLSPRVWSVTDASKSPLAPSQVSVTPSQISAMQPGESVRVVVRVHAGSGAYLGELVDAAGAVVEPDIYVSLG
jgi:hypothetical protein